MFNIVFKNGYELKADTVQESLRSFSGETEAVLIIQSTTSDNSDILEMGTKIEDGISEIKVSDNEKVVDTITKYSKVSSINKSIRPTGIYFYDIQLGR